MNELMLINSKPMIARAVYPGSEAEDPHPFYGYYTIHTMKDGEMSGMLSVNQYSGTVWYHNWHGTYIQSLEYN